MSVRTKVIRKNNSRRLESEYNRNAKQVVARAAAMVHATAVQSITDGNKSGESYEKWWWPLWVKQTKKPQLEMRS